MSVIRQQNWLGQQRVDVPHVRAIESSICADFDILAGDILAGIPVVVQGFDTITTGAVGQPASALRVNVAGAICMHPEASESGTIFQVPSARAIEILGTSNARLRGGFTANATNYVGFDLIRSADASTADLVQFLNPPTNLEIPKDVPLGRTLDYVLHVSTQDFSTTPGVCPIAVVVTDAANSVVSITDARNMYFRLGSGGSSPNATFAFPWGTGRTEVGNNSDFAAGDKTIASMKDWMDALMTRVWELGGGQYWYSPTNVINVQMVRTGSPFVSNGQYFEWDGTNLHWKGLKFLFDNTVAWNNTVSNQLTSSAGLTDLADGECIYVDINRATNATVPALKGVLATLGSPTIPGSRYVVAWRSGADVFTRNSDFAVGTSFAVATTSAVGMVKLAVTSATPGAPVVFNPGTNGELIVAGTGGNVTGVTAAGNGTGAGGSFTGGATGPALVVHGGPAGNLGAQQKFIDSAGNLRWGLDPAGFPTVGRRFEFRESWMFNIGAGQTASPMTNSTGWRAENGGGGVYSGGVSTTSSFPTIQINPGTANTNYSFIHTSPGGGFLNKNITAFTALSLEFDACLKVVGANNQTYWIGGFEGGFGDPFNNPGLAKGAFFRKTSAQTTWHAVVEDGGGLETEVDTGITPIANAFNNFRIHFFGSSTYVGAGTYYFFIDDVLKATITTNLPIVPYAMNVWAGGGCTGVAACTMHVGPVLCCYNKYNT